MYLLICRVNTFHANSTDAYTPEFWANESLAILAENMIASNLVHRDFEPLIARHGDTVNTRKPATFVAKRKGIYDDVTTQDAIATNVPVVLNQLSHVSFVIYDGENSFSMKNLIDEFIKPAMVAEAKLVDQSVFANYAQFLASSVGTIGGLTSSNASDLILDARGKLNTNLAPDDITRSIIWNSTSETTILKNQLFISAQQVGDSGDALENASLGRKLGFNNYMSQNATSVANAAVTIVTGAVNSTTMVKGTTAVTVDGLSAAIANNSWVTIAGVPYRVTSTTGGATPTVITIPSPGLREDVADNAVVKIFSPGAVNNAAGYAAGWTKEILLDGFSGVKFPAVGQMLTFGTTSSSAVYVVVQASQSAGTVLLDRPLDAALADSDAANPGPTGDVSFGFHKNAIALVTRPLAAVPAGMGGMSAVANWNGLSMRATLSYDGTKTGIRVTLDMLFGTKVLDSSLGVVIYS